MRRLLSPLRRSAGRPSPVRVPRQALAPTARRASTRRAPTEPYAAAAAAALAAAALGAGAAACDGYAEQFRGQYCASVTEFGSDGRVTVKNVDKYAKFLVNGTSGESMSLSVEERMALARCGVVSPARVEAAAWKKAGDRHGLRVIVHVGCDSTPDALALARHASGLGVAGISAMAPRFFKAASAEELASYCAELARAAPGTPFFYYHFPAATGVATKASAFFRAAVGTVPTLAGMKYSAADMYGDCCDADATGDLAFLPGFEAQTLAYLPFHPEATYGSVSLSYSVLAPLHAEIARAFYAGDAERAHALQATSRAFFRAVTPFGWTQSVKVLLHAKGVIDSPLMRAPAANLTPARRAELEATCAALAAADGSGLLGGLAVRKS